MWQNFCYKINYGNLQSLYKQQRNYCNAYITCASTGKAAAAIDGTTVHTTLKISLSNLHQLHTEDVYQYRALFKYVKVLIIDEVVISPV